MSKRVTDRIKAREAQKTPQAKLTYPEEVAAADTAPEKPAAKPKLAPKKSK